MSTRRRDFPVQQPRLFIACGKPGHEIVTDGLAGNLDGSVWCATCDIWYSPTGKERHHREGRDQHQE